MSYKTSLELAYHMGYEDALARKMPDTDKVAVLLPDVAAGAGEYIYGTDGHEGHWLTGEEIVRCRDCDLSQKDGTRCILFAGWEPIEGSDVYELVSADVEPDGFCAWGKRREDK